jgi:hypothetical protein
MEANEETKELPRRYWAIVNDVMRTRFFDRETKFGSVFLNVPYIVRTLIIGGVMMYKVRPEPGSTLLSVAWDVVLGLFGVAVFITPIVAFAEGLVVGLWRWWQRRAW